MTEIKMSVRKRSLFAAMTVFLAATAVGCGGGESTEPHDDEMGGGMETSESDAGSLMAHPRIFFVAPQDGAEISVDVPVVFEFGVENYEIGVVPETVDEARDGVGHYHLGVEATCLPSGQIIETGNPSWIHFGDGSNTIEMSLEPGEHTFSLQLADDEHRTLDGLCETITIMLDEGI